MAVTVYTGPPGAGKSYALVSEIIVSGVMAGRRVVTNVKGVNPDKVLAYCGTKAVESGVHPGDLGSVVTFDGEAALQPDFFPTEALSEEHTFIKNGDLVVFDEWALYFPKRGKWPNENVPLFLRWHRHLTNERGVSCDVVIGTQLASDVHIDVRGVVERSYKFRKLSAVGAKKGYAWFLWEGHLQPKGGHYAVGNGVYKKEIFELYSSYDATKGGTELRTDHRESIFGRSLYLLVGGVVLVLVMGVWGMWSFFTGFGQSGEGELQATPSGAVAAVPVELQEFPEQDRFRIVGQVIGDEGPRVVVMNNAGTMRMLSPENFEFYQDRPIAGLVDGVRVVAEEGVDVSTGDTIVELGQ